MGTNGNEISCERKEKSGRKTKSAKRTIQTKIPLRRKFNFITIISGKKFPKIWITSQGCPWALSIRPKFPTSWYGNFRRKFPENPEIVEIPRSEPFNRKFWKFQDENWMERKFPGNWVYPARLSSFSEILLIRDSLFSAIFLSVITAS